MIPINCRICKQSIDESQINLDNMLCYCPECNIYQIISKEASNSAFKRSMKTKVDMPKHYKIEQSISETSLVMKSRKKNVIVSASLGVPFIFIPSIMLNNSIDYITLIVLLIFLLGFLHFTLKVILEQKRIQIDNQQLSYQVKPYYTSQFKTNFKTNVDTITQLYVKQRRVSSGDNDKSVYDIILQSDQAPNQVMIKRISNHQDAIFIEQFIETHLGLVDEIQDEETPNISALIPTIKDLVLAVTGK